MSVTKLDHRWSGWPGAWCLDCGVPDPFEEAMAHGCADEIDGVWVMCHEHKNEPCKFPGQNLFGQGYNVEVIVEHS